MDRIAIFRRGFTGASLAWAAALPLAPFAASRPAAPTVVYLLTFAVYAIGSVVCHQRPERSFFLWSRQMPVCARCAGIYAGAAIAVLGSLVAPRFFARLLLLDRGRAGAGSGPGVGLSPRAFALLLVVPAAATLIYEWTTGVMPSNGIRAASGLCLGIGVAALIQREVN